MKRTVNWESRTRFYVIRKAMKWRCCRPDTHNFKYYWWRWIRCLRKSYQEFKNDMYESYLEHCLEYWTKNTTLDRINSDWDYCKENCTRATYTEQNSHLRNQKRYNRKWKQLLLKEIYEIEVVPVSYLVFKNRVCEYWRTVEQAVYVPKNKRPKF